jgi:hypothetical protein
MLDDEIPLMGVGADIKKSFLKKNYFIDSKVEKIKKKSK